MSCEMELEEFDVDPVKILRCHQDQHAANVSDQLHRFYREKKLIDLTIIAGVDKVAVGAHRAVLSASSDYFLAVFRSSLNEARFDTIELGEVDGETLEAVLDFMYTASIELHSKTVNNVLKTAHQLQFHTLIEVCSDFMAEQVDHTNCIGTAAFAEEQNYSVLQKKCLSYAFKNFSKVFEEEEFLKLDVSQLTKLFEHNMQRLPQEELFLCIVAWFKHDETDRGQFMHRLLSGHINFKSLDPKFIDKNRKSVCKIPDCCELICSWLGWHLADTKEEGKIIYASCLDSGLYVRSYCPRCNKWTLEDWPQPKQWRTSYSAVITNKKFILAGGEVEGVPTNTVECLDTQTRAWTDMPPISAARKYLDIVELNGSLYVIGGYDAAGKLVKTVEKYDFENSEMWESVTELPSTLSVPRATALSGKLYVLGSNRLSLLCYDPVTKDWTQTAPKIEKSSLFGIVSLKGHLYVIGGKLQSGEATKTFERYDPLSNSWMAVQAMLQARRSLACCAWNNRILVCGGEEKDHYLRNCFQFECRTKMWTSLADCTFANDKPFNTLNPSSELFSIL